MAKANLRTRKDSRKSLKHPYPGQRALWVWLPLHVMVKVGPATMPASGLYAAYVAACGSSQPLDKAIFCRNLTLYVGENRGATALGKGGEILVSAAVRA